MLENTFKRLMPEYQSANCVVSELGGMTNKNYLITVADEKFVLRIPGAQTEKMINRAYEAENSLIMSEKGFNVETCAFDKKTGIKITRFLKESFSLNHELINQSEILENIALHLRKLHQNQIKFNNHFDIYEEFYKYFDLLQNKNSFYNYDFFVPDILKFFEHTCSQLERTGRDKVSCHNDLVPENILCQNTRLYFIDWEYAGMNDPVFDIAAFLLESRLNENQQNLFLNTYYSGEKDLSDIKLDILSHQFTQDVLWFVWTLVKAEKHEHFGNYGSMRINRAYHTMLKLKS